MGCISGIARILLFAFNFILVVAGLALLIVGVLVKLNLDDVVPEDFASTAQVAPVLLIVIGCFIFVIAFLGCCGALRKSRCMLIMYIVTVACILVIQIVAGTYALTAIKGDSDLKKEIRDMYEEIFQKYYNNEVYTEYIDTVQQTLECCGITKPDDWPTPPASCYKGNKIGNEMYKKGCAGFVFDTIVDLSSMIGKVALGLCVTELLAIIFAFCLVC